MEAKNRNEIRNLIYTSLSLSEYTKIPILFMGNPGVAKTTGVRCWAEKHGYAMTTLIGTQRVAEEILGYMVNDVGERRLITYTPDWFDEIIENKKNGKKTLLFIDELSQAPDNVQGAMLQLIFDRKVGGKNNYLPEDCLVVSAANYKGNIPPQCGIQAPTLNRFCIINVNPDSGEKLIEEFLQSPSEREEDLPEFDNIEITPELSDSCRLKLKEMLIGLVNNYSLEDSGEGRKIIDFSNTNFNEIFDVEGDIYNFISGRTISYLERTLEGIIHLGIGKKAFADNLANMVYGLVGLGTNTFNNENEAQDYRKSLFKGFKTVIKTIIDQNLSHINHVTLDYSNSSVEKAISDWMRHSESSYNVNDENLANLLKKIHDTYPRDAQGMYDKMSSTDSTVLLTDLQKMDTLVTYLKKAGIKEINKDVNELSKVVNNWKAYKIALISSVVNN